MTFVNGTSDSGYSNIYWLSEQGMVLCLHGCGYEIPLSCGIEIYKWLVANKSNLKPHYYQAPQEMVGWYPTLGPSLESTLPWATHNRFS